MCFHLLFSYIERLSLFDSVHQHFYTWFDVIFFESVLYFAPSGSPSVSQHLITSGYLKKETVPKPLQVYIRCSKTMIPTSFPTNPISTIAGLVPLLSSALMIIDPLPLTVETDPSTSSQLDLPIALCKSK